MFSSMLCNRLVLDKKTCCDMAESYTDWQQQVGPNDFELNREESKL
jgi:hypothetical protein